MLRVLLIYGVKGPRGSEVLGSRGPVFTVCHLVVLKLDKEFFSLERDLIFVAAYHTPECSTVFNAYEKARFEHIEEKINQIV